MLEILLSGGKKAMISEEDSELMNKKWQLDPYGYPKRSPVLAERLDGVPSTYMLHREVMSRVLGRLLDHKEIVDHINSNKLDARRENLRIASVSQNMRNCRKSEGKSSKYKGVAWDKTKNRWQLKVYKNKRLISIAVGKDEVLLARLYDLVVLYHFSDANKLNFVEEFSKYKGLLSDYGDPLSNVRVYKDILKGGL